MTAAMSSNWAYAVPLDESSAYGQSPQSEQFTPHDATAPVAREGPSQTARRRTSDYDIRGDAESRRRRVPSKPPSQASRKRSKNTLRDNAKTEGRMDDSAWIHRDKLAQIEIREMQEAGFHVRQISQSMSVEPLDSARESRSASRSRMARSDSQEFENAAIDDIQHDPAYTSFDDFQRKRVSTIHANDEAEAEHELPVLQSSHSDSNGPHKHTSRPSTSRIPMAKTSTVPVPQNVVDRDSPLRRSRSNSGALNNWDETQYSRRARSNSIASQAVLDEFTKPLNHYDEPVHSDNARSSKPAGKRSASNARKPTTSARRTSSQANGRPGSAGKKTTRQPSVSGKRPGSSSESPTRPGTSQAHYTPEGDPPWLATMYKPDPRLPPDQQILPTHAKRMMQEQWAREGKTGTVYDKDFRLLNDETLHAPKSYANGNDGSYLDFDHTKIQRPSPSLSPTRSTSPVKQPDDLRTDPRSDAVSIRSGGYRITPIVDTFPTQHGTISIQSPGSTAFPSITQPGSQRHTSARVPQLDDKDEATQKKGVCCVVM